MVDDLDTDLIEASDTADELEAEYHRLRRVVQRSATLGVVFGAGAALQAWPGGFGYALSWLLGFVAAGVVLALPPLRKLRALEGRRNRLQLIEDGES